MRSAALLLLALACVPARASEDGGVQGPFYFSIGAAALGRGGTLAAASDGLYAIGGNPAGLAALDAKEVGAMHMGLFQGTSYDTLGYAHPVVGLGALGLQVTRLTTAGSQVRDSLGGVTGAGVSDAFTELTLAYGNRILPWLGGGLALKGEQASFAGRSALGVGLDAGVSLDLGPSELRGLPPWDFRAGLLVQNILPPRLPLSAQNPQLPRMISIGVAGGVHLSDRLRDRLSLSFDVSRALLSGSLTRSQPGTMGRAGIEYAAWGKVAVRAGYDGMGPTFGLGVSMARFRLDYAAALHPLAASHRVSLLLEFGNTVHEMSEQRRASDAARIEAAVKRRLADELKRERAAQAGELMKDGVALYKANQFTEAVLQFEKAASWSPDDEKIKKNLQVARAAVENAKKTEQAESKRRLVSEAQAHFTAERFLDAVAAWRAALEIDPQDSSLAQRIEETREKLRQREAAARTAATSGADAAKAEQARLFSQMALNSLVGGNYEEAAANWRRAMALDPLNKDVADRLVQAERLAAEQKKKQDTHVRAVDVAKLRKQYLDGVLAYADGDLQKAIQVWQSVLDQDPRHTEALRDIDRARRKLKYLQGTVAK